jgi:hypothetical protein
VQVFRARARDILEMEVESRWTFWRDVTWEVMPRLGDGCVRGGPHFPLSAKVRHYAGCHWFEHLDLEGSTQTRLNGYQTDENLL